jgi:hypothetical protein
MIDVRMPRATLRALFDPQAELLRKRMFADPDLNICSGFLLPPFPRCHLFWGFSGDRQAVGPLVGSLRSGRSVMG